MATKKRSIPLADTGIDWSSPVGAPTLTNPAPQPVERAGVLAATAAALAAGGDPFGDDDDDTTAAADGADDQGDDSDDAGAADDEGTENDAGAVESDSTQDGGDALSADALAAIAGEAPHPWRLMVLALAGVAAALEPARQGSTWRHLAPKEGDDDAYQQPVRQARHDHRSA